MKVFYNPESDAYESVKYLENLYNELKEDGDTNAENFDEFLSGCDLLESAKYSSDQIESIAVDYCNWIKDEEHDHTNDIYEGIAYNIQLMTKAQEEQTAEELQELKETAQEYSNLYRHEYGYTPEELDEVLQFVAYMEALQKVASGEELLVEM